MAEMTYHEFTLSSMIPLSKDFIKGLLCRSCFQLVGRSPEDTKQLLDASENERLQSVFKKFSVVSVEVCKRRKLNKVFLGKLRQLQKREKGESTLYPSETVLRRRDTGEGVGGVHIEATS